MEIRYMRRSAYYCRGLIAAAILATSAFGGDDALARAELWVEYLDCCEDAPAGVYETYEFVFFVVEVEITEKNGARRLWEGRAMLDAGRALREYIATGKRGGAGGHAPRKDTARNSQSKRPPTPSYGETTVESLPTRIVVNRAVGTNYRYVVAVNRRDLEKQRNEKADTATRQGY